jgi:translation initiation factor 1
MVQRKSKLVYSTDGEQDIDTRKISASTPAQSLPPQQQTISVLLDRKRRRGKTVTLCSGFVLSADDLRQVEKTLKQLCGAGGTSKDGEIEIQGEHRERIMSKLAEMNFKVKRVGG